MDDDNYIDGDIKLTDDVISGLGRSKGGDRLLALLATDASHPEVQTWIAEVRTHVEGASFMSDEEIIEMSIMMLSMVGSAELAEITGATLDN